MLLDMTSKQDLKQVLFSYVLSLANAYMLWLFGFESLIKILDAEWLVGQFLTVSR